MKEYTQNCAAVGVTAEEAADGACRLLKLFEKTKYKNANTESE